MLHRLGRLQALLVRSQHPDICGDCISKATKNEAIVLFSISAMRILSVKASSRNRIGSDYLRGWICANVRNSCVQIVRDLTLQMMYNVECLPPRPWETIGSFDGGIVPLVCAYESQGQFGVLYNEVCLDVDQE